MKIILLLITILVAAEVSADQDAFEIFNSMCKSLTYSSRVQLHKLQGVLKSHSDMISYGVGPKLPVMTLHVRDARKTLKDHNISDSDILNDQHKQLVKSLLKVNATMDQFSRAYIKNCSNFVIQAEKKLVQYVKDMVAEAGAIEAKRGISTVCLNQFGGVFTVTVQPSVMKIDQCLLEEIRVKSTRSVGLQSKWIKVDNIYTKYIQRLTLCSMKRPLTKATFDHCCQQDSKIYGSIEHVLDDYLESFTIEPLETCINKQLEETMTKLKPFKADFITCLLKKRENKKDENNEKNEKKKDL